MTAPRTKRWPPISQTGGAAWGGQDTQNELAGKQARERETTCPRSGFGKNVITFLDHYSAWIAAPAVHRQISIRVCHNALR